MKYDTKRRYPQNHKPVEMMTCVYPVPKITVANTICDPNLDPRMLLLRRLQVNSSGGPIWMMLYLDVVLVRCRLTIHNESG